MLDHVGITVADIQRSAAFYDQVLAVLGHRRLMDYGEAIGYGADAPDFWISSGATARREDHIAFVAPDAEAVRAFHAAALAAGAEELHAPRLWPEYHEGYYGAFVRDPDGNNVEAVCHTVASDQA
ncbi:glyoxalase [Tessaracoccus aquimaris]|uniref:Glyoxalase n=1 Tax=Tessaracoccus aquimaris TaxID=1332264 RepID=A0A1Q2CKB5_9ACTN|nr:VOC family protein [Tessaracoccus aquimaris]AQP46544.1 glyoxalase [Tessaracoccus aquimaris]